MATKRPKGKPNGAAGRARSKTGGKATRTLASRSSSGRSSPRKPRQPALPTMKQARDERLDAMMEDLSDVRAILNDKTAEQKGLMASITKHMNERGHKMRRHSGLEIHFVPGGDKIRVRVTKEENADTEGEGAGEEEGAAAGDDEQSSGAGELGAEG